MSRSSVRLFADICRGSVAPAPALSLLGNARTCVIVVTAPLLRFLLFARGLRRFRLGQGCGFLSFFTRGFLRHNFSPYVRWLLIQAALAGRQGNDCQIAFSALLSGGMAAIFQASRVLPDFRSRFASGFNASSNSSTE